jgi:hypothetical protein
MNVYQLQPSSDDNPKWVRFYTKHKLATPMSSNEDEAFFDAHPRIEIDRNTDSTPRGSKARFGDYSNLSHDVYPVLSDRAKQVFESHLKGLGRWVELISDEATYWLFVITNVVDALDVPKSKIAYFPSTPGKVMGIDSFAFKPEVVENQLLFTLPYQPRRDRLVTDRFVDIVREHRLTAFQFELLWSSDKGPAPTGLKDWEKPRITGLEAG